MQSRRTKPFIFGLYFSISFRWMKSASKLTLTRLLHTHGVKIGKDHSRSLQTWLVVPKTTSHFDIWNFSPIFPLFISASIPIRIFNLTFDPILEVFSCFGQNAPASTSAVSLFHTRSTPSCLLVVICFVMCRHSKRFFKSAKSLRRYVIYYETPVCLDVS